MKNDFFTLPNDGQTLLFGNPTELKNVTVCGFISESSPVSAASIAAILNSAPEMLAVLTGAEKALKKALPFCPADSEAVFVGEWLGEVSTVLNLNSSRK